MPTGAPLDVFLPPQEGKDYSEPQVIHVSPLPLLLEKPPEFGWMRASNPAVG